MDPRPPFPSGLLNPPKTRFPLSSPIVEEPPTQFGVLSGSFESADDLLVRDSNGNDTREDEEDLLESRWSLDSGSAHGGKWNAARRLGRSTTKKSPKKRPGLNLVTTFPTLSVPKHRTQQRSKNEASSGLNDFRSLSRTVQNKITKDRRHSYKRRSTTGYSELTDEPVRNRIQELSPSDRPIVIGMQLPRDSVDEGDIRSHTLDDTKLKAFPRDGNPKAPTIIITPAKKPSWDTAFDDPKSSPLRPPRPPSSVYSQATPLPWMSRDDIPPVPPLPEHFARRQQSDDVFTDEPPTPMRRQRACSVGTVFEDENLSPASHRSRHRSLSEAAKQRMFKGLSMETIAAYRRSQGWWNLLSPMLSRSNTIVSPRSHKDLPPPLPSAATNWSDFMNEKNTKEVSTFSPDTPEHVSTFGEKSMRSSVTRWPGSDCRVEPDNTSCDSPRYISEHKDSPSSATSSRTIPFMMSNPVTETPTAPQHCHACIHEINANPYYGAIPHSCSTNTVIVHHRSPTASPETNHVSKSVIQGPLTTINENPNNPFFQKFVDSLRSERAMPPRPDSTSTTFEDVVDISPTVRMASVAPVLRSNVATPITGRASESGQGARFSITGSPKRSQPATFSSPRSDKIVRYKAILPPGIQTHLQQPHSPAPITPGAQNIISGPDGIHMAETPQPPLPAYLPGRRNLSPQTDSSSDTRRVPQLRVPISIPGAGHFRHQKHERSATYSSNTKKTGGFWLRLNCFGNRGYKQRLSDETDYSVRSQDRRKKRRWCMIIIIILIIIIIILSIVLPIVLLLGAGGGGGEVAEEDKGGKSENEKPVETDKGDKNDGPISAPVDERWLNLTGYPPMPTGISTIAGPETSVKKSRCVRPATMWSCSLPKELHDDNEPYDADRPNFKIQISFQNGTYDHPTSEKSGSGKAKRILMYLMGKRARIDDADPPPPSLEDMEFLGNTTDGIESDLYTGEETPFFASVLSPYDEPSLTNEKRAKPSSTSSFPNLTDVIPPPALDTDGTAAPATLYPLPRSQPLRLYDRGLSTEHYGFYTYFDKSIFLKSTDPMDPSSNGGGDNVPGDLDGGSTKSAARVKCTWAQTRFLVQIWTQPKQAGMVLMDPDDDHTPAPPAPSSDTDYENNFVIPGSFPYPVTFSLDRHGGLARHKMVYCYGVDLRGRIEQDEKKLQLEFRDAGGTLIDPAGGIFNITKRADEDEDIRPIDGGTGGCSCEWRNWVVG